MCTVVEVVIKWHLCDIREYILLAFLGALASTFISCLSIIFPFIEGHVTALSDIDTTIRGHDASYFIVNTVARCSTTTLSKNWAVGWRPPGLPPFASVRSRKPSYLPMEPGQKAIEVMLPYRHPSDLH
jgi:hypothetical protein